MPNQLPILFAESPVVTILLGILVVCVAFLMRRAGRKRSNTSGVNTAEEVRQQFAAQLVGRKEVEKLELRLHEFAREVDALAQTRIAVLKELIAAADQAIVELERHIGDRELSPEQRRMIVLLSQAGYDAGEIATLIGRREPDVAVILAQSGKRNGGAQAA